MKKTQKKIETRGGARPGAGRPRAAAPTTTLSWRVPASIAPALREKINTLINKEIARLKVDQGQDF